MGTRRQGRTAPLSLYLQHTLGTRDAFDTAIQPYGHFERSGKAFENAFDEVMGLAGVKDLGVKREAG